MSPRWEDVNARARGMGGRLLPRQAITPLSEARTLAELARELTALGVIPESGVLEAPDLALALRRAAAREVRILRRWLGDRDAVLAVALDDEDRRSLRAVLRGAAEGAPAEARLAGLIPTPTLPERLLRELAERARVAEQAALLIAGGHPAGAAILAVATEAEPDLFRIELAMTHAFAARAVRGSLRGGPFLRGYVASSVDRENCRTALSLAASGGEEPSEPAFVAGGRLGLAEFVRAANAGGSAAAARLLGATNAVRDLAPLLLRHAAAPAALEEAFEQHVLLTLRNQARQDPLGPAPVLLYLARLRRQTAALAGILWGVELGAPAAVRLVSAMVTT